MFSAEAINATCTSIVCERVNMMRSHGFCLAEAQADAAGFFNLTIRRARAYWNKEVRLITAAEADLIRARHRLLLRERQRRLNDELAALQMRIAAFDGGE